MSLTFFAFWGAVFGGLAVVLGAFGAHALKETLSSYGLNIWEKAVFYQAFHAIVLLIIPTLSNMVNPKYLNWSGTFFIAGIILFSGSLYMLAISQKKYLGAITPLGGVAFIIAWSILAWALFKQGIQG